MRILYQTRFSYLGKSGWRSEANGDARVLYDPARLARRFALFEQVTLASLAAQSDPDFRHMILVGRAMPAPWQRRLRELALDMLGPKRVTVMVRPPGHAAGQFRRYVRRHHTDAATLVQVVLDDDDGLARDFTGRLRADAAHHAARLGPAGYCYLSYAAGLSLLWTQTPRRLVRRHVPFTNLGLALVAAPDTPHHPYATSHRRIGQRHPSCLVTGGRPNYVRVVHDDNDSRATVGTGRLDAAAQSAALDAFPWLAPLLEPSAPPMTPAAPQPLAPLAPPP